MATDKGRDKSNRSTSQAEFEDTIRSIYYYQQSYFRADSIAVGILPKIIFKDSPPASDNYCIDSLWKVKADQKDLLSLGYSDASDQPSCNGLSVVDDDVGLSF